MFIKEVEIGISYNFKLKHLLIEALTHKSCGKDYNYEKLEFLGDRVLGLIIAEKLNKIMSNFKVADIHLKFESLTNEAFLAKIARDIKITPFIQVQPGNDGEKFKNNNSILADVVEAIIGGIYIDSGIKDVKNFIDRFFIIDDKMPILNPKSSLQQMALENGKELPSYKLLKREGLDHNPKFWVNVSALSYNSEGIGKSLKLAEINAAFNLLKKIKRKV